MLMETIANEAAFQLGNVDGFFVGQSGLGIALEFDGLADMTPYLQAVEDRYDDWNDIFEGYRQHFSRYQGKTVSIPIGGDAHFMYYRRDILEHFNLSIPRTWEEYGDVAATVHGQSFEGEIISGGCVGRSGQSCPGYIVANMIIASMTQARGPSEGHTLDTFDLSPLVSDAVIAETLKLLEVQTENGSKDGKFIQVFLQQGIVITT
jgi:hypothetical protein